MSHPFVSGLNKGMISNPGGSGMQFYNPTKDLSNPSLLGQHSQSSNTLNGSTQLSKFKSAKQFNFKPYSITDAKSNQNKVGSSSTIFSKPQNQNLGGSNKYIPNGGNGISSSSIMNKTLNSGLSNNPSTTFSSLNHNKSLNSQMIKSSIQDRQPKKDDILSKQTKFKTFQTPRRAPRMSQPLNANLQIKYQISNQNTTSQNTDSPPTFLKERQRQKEGRFQKFKQFQSPTSQKFDKQLHYGAHKNNPAFRGTEHKNSIVVEQGSLSKKLYGSRGNKRVSMEDFDRIKELGAGKYGKVFLAKQKYTGFVCAVKMIEKQLLRDQQIVEQFIRQLKIQIFLSHPHIIKMYGYFDDQTNIYIILQVGTGGQLYHQLKRTQTMPEQKVAGYMKQVCEAVNQIHSLRIIHRDIKPQNIVLHQNIIKLCDFGWSVHQDNKMRTTFCGTPLYVCPQILRGKQYDQKIDIWSLGIMMYEMLVGQNPFKITKQQQLIKIVKDKIEIPSYVYVSNQARDFLDKCLQKNPLQRVNIRQLLNHDLFKKYPDKSEKKMAF